MRREFGRVVATALLGDVTGDGGYPHGRRQRHRQRHDGSPIAGQGADPPGWRLTFTSNMRASHSATLSSPGHAILRAAALLTRADLDQVIGGMVAKLITCAWSVRSAVKILGTSFRGKRLRGQSMRRATLHDINRPGKRRQTH
jgi:hypothetical protein